MPSSDNFSTSTQGLEQRSPSVKAERKEGGGATAGGGRKRGIITIIIIIIIIIQIDQYLR